MSEAGDASPPAGTLERRDSMRSLQKLRARQTSRVRDLVRALPVLGVVLIALMLYIVFWLLHGVPMLQLGIPGGARNDKRRTRAIIELVVFNYLSVMFLWNYILTILTPPGTIPATPEWQLPSAGGGEHSSPSTAVLPQTSSLQARSPLTSATAVNRPDPRKPPQRAELKKSGGTRNCKWCHAIKPDRAHHCRVCRQCVLRMDHHCPWVYNCIGWGNHKYFVLLVFYATCLLLFAVIAQLESVVRAFDEPTVPFGSLFMLLFSETLGSLLAFVCASFFIFHMWLTYKGMSTIEFCEKKFRRGGQNELFNHGCYRNFKETLGENPLLWPFPIDDRAGDGLSFAVSSRAAAAAIESSGNSSDMPLITSPPPGDSKV